MEKMKITVKRTHRTNISTIGELYIDGVFECYTLEDIEREVKIKSETAIPKGMDNLEKHLINYLKKCKQQKI